MNNDEFLRANLDNWNDRVPIHLGPGGYSVEKLATDEEWISDTVAFDREYLGDVRGQRLLHSQCHIGTDTLSFAKLGANVTGFDFSLPAIEAARAIAERMDVPANFVHSDVDSACENIREHFDIVYTGVGAIGWLPDVRVWAKVMAGFLIRGGTFYIREYHPMFWTIDEQKFGKGDDAFRIEYPYFETEEPITLEESTSYAGEGTLEHSKIYTWNHGLGEIIGALIENGLEIRAFDEHRFSETPDLANMELGDRGYVLPPAKRDQLPLMYSILASKK